MRTIYVVTHPEATHHVDRLVGGQYDSDLTERGRSDAERVAVELAARLSHGGPAEVVSSDLLRTRRTAQLVADRMDTGVRLDPRLREKSYGEAGGKPQAWLDARFIPPPPVGDRMRHDEGIPGAETKWDLAVRVYAAMADILSSPVSQQVVVTHGMAATFVLAAWVEMPMEAAGRVAFRFTSGGITTLEEDDYFHNRAVRELNFVGHLA
ncbi:histidine phosphatase family protein [Sanguibacter sp. 25GB23B1]|uniref:histidine phosphatase family protein n=1 Tax=unclassified Sanguibacter TaxID=2645534 RepID=UPI0032AF15F8